MSELFAYSFCTAVLLGPVVYIIWLAWRAHNYWHRQGVPCIPGVLFVGNLAPLLGQRSSAAELYDSVYNDERTRDSAVIGVNVFMRPALMIRDVQLIRRVLVADFSSFCNRYASSDVHNDVMGSCSLLLQKDPAWRTARARMTPFFTVGKLRQMYGLMGECGRQLGDVLDGLVRREGDRAVAEVKDIFACYATDVIASCAFGVQSDCLRNPNSDFRQQGRRFFEHTLWRKLEMLSVFFLPAAVPIFGFSLFSPKFKEFMRESIGHVMDERVKSKNVRNDLIDTLIELREEDKDKTFTVENQVFQGDVLVAQAATFFTAAFETTSTTLAFAIYELCRRPDIQSRIRAEIRCVLAECAPRSEPTHDEIYANTDYISAVIAETLRLYPAVPFLDRECTVAADSTYDLSPISPYRIPAAMPVLIPIYSLQRDACYFPQPERFDPERFAPDNLPRIEPYAYMPFGTGPRNCIGSRFALLQIRVALFELFRRCRVEPAPGGRTPERLSYEKRFFITAENGVTVALVRDEVSV